MSRKGALSSFFAFSFFSPCLVGLLTLTASHQAAQLLFHAALLLLQPLELLLLALRIDTQLADLFETHRRGRSLSARASPSAAINYAAGPAGA